jgi:hypothetical protein
MKGETVEIETVEVNDNVDRYWYISKTRVKPNRWEHKMVVVLVNGYTDRESAMQRSECFLRRKFAGASIGEISVMTVDYVTYKKWDDYALLCDMDSTLAFISPKNRPNMDDFYDTIYRLADELGVVDDDTAVYYVKEDRDTGR